MGKQTAFLVSSGLALVLALGFAVRMFLLRQDFDRTVLKALKTSASYDKSFIRTVNSLETELANRASFGYEGGKDPMTGQVRRVVLPPKAVVPLRNAPSTAVQKAPEPQTDPVKLTAIIYDDRNRRYTAVVMDGERSLSLEVGDKVRGRVVRKITEEIIIMEGDSLFYQYDIRGRRATKRK